MRERFDRVILDKKIESRESYMKILPRLCQQVKKQAETVAIAIIGTRFPGTRPPARSVSDFRKSSGHRCKSCIRSFTSNRRSWRNS